MKWEIDTMQMPDGLAVRLNYDCAIETWEEATLFMDKVERLYRNPYLILVEEEL